MNNEIITQIGNRKYKIFFQPGFYSFVSTTSLHDHKFAEIHIMIKGEMSFVAGGNSYHLKEGNLILVPQGVYHCCHPYDEDVLHTAFQIDSNLKSVVTADVGETAKKFYEEIKKCDKTGDYTAVSAYIALFYSCFCDEIFSAKPVDDYGFLIHDFFSTRYAEDLHLQDLADTLHLSERQCERIIKLHTGNTFREELIRVRMNIAHSLIKSSGMRKKDIAQYVGYKSYAGFCKAVKQSGIKL